MSYRIGLGVEHAMFDLCVPRDATVEAARDAIWNNGPIRLYVGNDPAVALAFIDDDDVVALRVASVWRLVDGHYECVSGDHVGAGSLRRVLEVGVRR